MEPIEITTLSSYEGFDLDKQRALYTLWLLLTTFPLALDPDTVIVKDDTGVAEVKVEAAQSAGTVYYLDLRNLFPTLSPFQIGDVEAIVARARQTAPDSNPPFRSVSSTFQSTGAGYLNYDVEHICNTVGSILAIRKAASAMSMIGPAKIKRH